MWGSDGRHQLFDLAADPDESRNLIDDPPHAVVRDRLLADLKETVVRVMGQPPLSPPPAPGTPLSGFEGQDMDEETLRRLRSLGYVD